MSKLKKLPLNRSESSGQPDKKNVVTVYIGDTEYDIIKTVAKDSLNWKLTENETANWDLTWTDSSVPCEKLSKMKPYQKINHFPGMHGICKKHYLAWNLNKMSKVYPQDFNFFPKTFVLPGDRLTLKQYADKGKVFIVKPEASSQGHGIYLLNNIEDINQSERLVVQEYLKEPYLIDGLKFDLRVYVLVKSCDPLQVLIHEDGLTRLATEAYVDPSKENFTKVCMHLTNYAINKTSSKFVFNKSEENDDVGHKRSLLSTFKLLKDRGHDVERLKEEIEDIVAKTLCCVQPTLKYNYRSAQPGDVGGSMCFELLGFDIILDRNLKPWLLEVNHSPSFTTDSPLDFRIKHRLIKETLELLQLSPAGRAGCTKNPKLRYLDRQKQEILEIMNTTSTLSDCHDLKTGFKSIFPLDSMAKLSGFIETATKHWAEVSKHPVSRPNPKPVSKVTIRPFSRTRPLVPRRRPNYSNTSLIKPSQSLVISEEQKEGESEGLKKLIETSNLSFNFLNGKDLVYYSQLNEIFKHRRHSITYLKGTEFHSSVIKLLKPIEKSKDVSVGGFLAPKSFEFIPICLNKTQVYKKP